MIKNIVVKGAREHNLKNIDVEIPRDKLVVLTGLSGSGKSSLVNEVLYKTLAGRLNHAKLRPGKCDGIDGVEYLDKIINIDQSPIGRTPRSNPATYTGLFDDIRSLFASTQDAKLRGYSAGRFSFNIRGGRCEACSGDGQLKIEMHFLPDVYVPCEVCKGKRYNRETLEVHYKGKNIAEVLDMTVEEALAFFQNQPKIRDRLQTLMDVGLGYVKLGQPSTTLSGGEAQRIKIARYINSPLTDMMYVLDEPSVGLHSRDIQKLKNSLIKLKEHGNTVLIVEHHREIIALADHIVDMGPEAGINGGQIMYQGSYEGLLKADTVTGRMLRIKTPVKMEYRKPTGWYQLEHANLHNLKNVNVKLPLGVMTVIAGVAGSGKSSLMEYFTSQYPGEVISIRQKDIGINLRSTPATYLDIADKIRALFAKENHIARSYFSFNSKGACPVCQGKGVIISDMAYMDSIETVCEVCHGTRYSEEVLKYQYKGKNIAEVMNMTVRQAIRFFENTDFVNKLDMLEQVGLGYLHLNQSMTTLSGGELQRVKLADKLEERGQIFILDEPTDGLHLDDIRRLMKLFNKMTDQGNTLFIIEHSLDVMKDADYIVELGPEGGQAGGEILFTGTPKEMLESSGSVTREYLSD